MQVSINQQFTTQKLNYKLRFKVVICFVFMVMVVSVSSVKSQAPGKPDQAATSEKAQDQPLNKKPGPEEKAQLQQKQLADDTAKLLELANELKADMDKTTKDTLSLAVIKKAEQVEKLARKVRDEMKASLGN